MTTQQFKLLTPYISIFFGILFGMLFVTLIMSLYIGSASTNTSPNPSHIATAPETNTTPIQTISPIPSTTPNPYGLDTDGYYIADTVAWPDHTYTQEDGENHFFMITYNNTEYNPYKYNPSKTKKIQTHPKSKNPSIDELYANPNYEIKLRFSNTISTASNESFIFDGTTNLPAGTIIPISIHEIIETTGGINKWMFAAPILPGKNGINLIKIKIPAINIHKTDNYNDILSNNTIIRNILIGDSIFTVEIKYDSTHPLIIEHNTMNFEQGLGRTYTNPNATWAWTNDLETTHHWNNGNSYYQPHLNTPAIQPYPTYPRPPQSW
jgi:hypothetical protein